MATSDRETSKDAEIEETPHTLRPAARGTARGLLTMIGKSADASIPALLGHRVGYDLSEMKEAMEADYDDTFYFACALIVAHIEAGFSTDRPQANSLAEPSVRVGAGDAMILTNDPDQITDEDMAAFMLKFNGSRDFHAIWYSKLIFAQQHKALTDQNFKSFLAQRNEKAMNRNVLRRIIDVLARQAPRLTGNDDIREALVDDDWMKYRTSAASTPTLVKSALDLLGNFYTFPPEWTASVEAALATPGDLEMVRRIPEVLVVLTAAFLKAIENYPEHWYQGNRAISGSLKMLYRKQLDIMTRYKNVFVALPDTGAATNIAELKALLPESDLNFTA